MKMALTDMFGVEKAFALCYTGYTDRIKPLKKELSRVGILDETEFVYTFKNPFDQFFRQSIRHDDNLDKNPGLYNLTMGHYGILKTALGLGLNKIMVVEDDCRFANDIDRVVRDMKDAPSDWEVLILDSFKLLESDKGKTGWVPCIFSRSAAAYCISRTGMEKLTGLIESSIDEGRQERVLKHIDSYFDPKELFAVAKAYRVLPNIAIQVRSDSKSVSGVDERLYRSIGIDCENYAKFN